MEQYPMLRYFCYRQSFNRLHPRSLYMRENWLCYFVSFRSCFIHAWNEIYIQWTYKSFKIDKQLEKNYRFQGSAVSTIIIKSQSAERGNQGSSLRSQGSTFVTANLFLQFSNDNENRNLINYCYVVYNYGWQVRKSRAPVVKVTCNSNRYYPVTNCYIRTYMRRILLHVRLNISISCSNCISYISETIRNFSTVWVFTWGFNLVPQIRASYSYCAIKPSALIIFLTFDTRRRRVDYVYASYLRFLHENEGKQPGKVPLQHFLAIILESSRDSPLVSHWLMQLVLMPDKNLTRSTVILIRLNLVRTRLDECRPICAMITAANRAGNDNDNQCNANASMSLLL